MDDPYFSVVIPTYNRADYISKTIDSVLTQDFQSFELIIVDDGSTDDTGSVVGRYQDNRIRYICQANAERAAARNVGIRNAKGTYVTFLDSDDIFLPHHLSSARTFIDNHSPVIFHLGYNVCAPDGKVLSLWKPLPNPANWKLLSGNYLSCMGVFLNRTAIAGHQFNEDRALSGSEDYEYWLRLSAHYDIQTSSEVTSVLINHETRSVLKMDPSKLIHRINTLKRCVKQNHAIVGKYGKALDRWEAYIDLYTALHLSLLKGQAPEAMHYLWCAFRRSPGVIFSLRFWVIPKKLLLD